MSLFPELRSTAALSDCGRFRYSLTRTWGDHENRCCWIMLNPSTADADQDDPTIRRCVGFSRAWGHGGLIVVNLFALRSTSPKALYGTMDRVGPQNPEAILAAVASSRRVVCAWGNHGALGGRGEELRRALVACGVELQHLGLTKAGQPNHPLYLRGDLRPTVWA